MGLSVTLHRNLWVDALAWFRIGDYFLHKSGTFSPFIFLCDKGFLESFQINSLSLKYLLNQDSTLELLIGLFSFLKMCGHTSVSADASIPGHTGIFMFHHKDDICEQAWFFWVFWSYISSRLTIFEYTFSMLNSFCIVYLTVSALVFIFFISTRNLLFNALLNFQVNHDRGTTPQRHRLQPGLKSTLKVKMKRVVPKGSRIPTFQYQSTPKWLHGTGLQFPNLVGDTSYEI